MAESNKKFIVAAAFLSLLLIAGSVAAIAITPDEANSHLHASQPAGVTGEVAAPERHLGPQGKNGQFIAECAYSHSATDDPIVHYQHPGRSHLHDFYGATTTNAFSTPDQLLASDTTCDKTADRAAYWQPALYDHDEKVEPISVDAYYRAAPGVEPTDVQPYPLGLALITGDAMAEVPQPGEAAGWTCGSRSALSDDPPDCPASAPLTLLLTFQDCWDGAHIDSDDHQAHVTFSAGGECPASHPVNIPQLTASFKFPIHGSGHNLRLASGNIYSAHGDFFNAWEPEGLEREINACIHNGVVCDLASNRDDDVGFNRETLERFENQK